MKKFKWQENQTNKEKISQCSHLLSRAAVMFPPQGLYGSVQQEESRWRFTSLQWPEPWWGLADLIATSRDSFCGMGS
jgi:hypothetical protein